MYNAEPAFNKTRLVLKRTKSVAKFSLFTTVHGILRVSKMCVI